MTEVPLSLATEGGKISEVIQDELAAERTLWHVLPEKPWREMMEWVCVIWLVGELKDYLKTVLLIIRLKIPRSPGPSRPVRGWSTVPQAERHKKRRNEWLHSSLWKTGYIFKCDTQKTSSEYCFVFFTVLPNTVLDSLLYLVTLYCTGYCVYLHCTIFVTVFIDTVLYLLLYLFTLYCICSHCTVFIYTVPVFVTVFIDTVLYSVM